MDVVPGDKFRLDKKVGIMKQIKAIFLTSLLSVILLNPVTTLGAETVKLKQGQGTIIDINHGAGTMVVDDAMLLLKPGYTVKNHKGEEISAFNLRRGKKVSVKYAPGMVVKEITIK